MCKLFYRFAVRNKEVGPLKKKWPGEPGRSLKTTSACSLVVIRCITMLHHLLCQVNKERIKNEKEGATSFFCKKIIWCP